jgi:hypothetical protein
MDFGQSEVFATSSAMFGGLFLEGHLLRGGMNRALRHPPDLSSPDFDIIIK